MISQDTVFAHDGHNVRCYTNRYQVEQGSELIKFDAVVDGKGLHELEPYAASRQVFVRISGIRTLGVQNGNSRR